MFWNRKSAYGRRCKNGRHGAARLRLEQMDDRILPSTYSITDIGTVAFSNANLGFGGPALSINNASAPQVVGERGSHAFLWDSVHGMQDLGTSSQDNLSAAYGINSAGQVTGVSEKVTTKISKSKWGDYPYTVISSQNGFVWTGAQGMKSVGNSVYPTGINSSGELSGTTNGSAALLKGNNWTSLGTLPGGTFTRGSGLNDYGQVVGYGDFVGNPSNLTHAFLWTPASPNGTAGTMIDLGVFGSTGPTDGASAAAAINTQGWITGWTSDLNIASGANHAFVWRPSTLNGTTGTMIDLGTLAVNSSPGLSQSEGLAINGSGVIVGDANPQGVTNQSSTHAVIWEPGAGGSYALSDLNDLIPAGSGWTLTKADAINDNGQIVVETAQGHALLLTPTTSLKAATPLSPRGQTPTSSSGGSLVVGSFDNNAVLSYDETTGVYESQFDPHNQASVKTPVGGVFGPDGNLYVSSGLFSNGSRHGVLQYNGTTGAFQREFATQNITSPRGILFGPDGNLYVANGNEGADPASVERFDGRTGAFLDYFVAPNSGGIAHPSYMVFGPDGLNDGKLDLYVANAHDGNILRYDGTTGASKGIFVSGGTGGLDSPQGMVFGADGNLYVASGNWFNGINGPFYTGDFPPGAVLRYQGPTGANPGAFMGTFVASGSGGLANPAGMIFGPGGDLYVASAVMTGRSANIQVVSGTSDVLRYDGETGAFLGAFVTPASGGLKFPTFLTFTETNPTTLNYDGTVAARSSSPRYVLSAPSSALTLGPLTLISNPDPLANSPPVPILPPDAAAEPYVAVNPTNPQNIVAAWIAHGGAGNADSASFDGGQTWQNVAIPGISQATGGANLQAANNWLSFAPNGDLYSIGLGAAGGPWKILVNKSTDGGVTWSNPIQLNTIGNPAHVDDKPSITADPSNPNYVYATWASLNPSFGPGNRMETMFARSIDGGTTWQPAQSIHQASSGDLNYGHQIVVLPNGTLIDAFTEGQFTKNHTATLTLLRSTDHGQTWSAPIHAVTQQPLVDPNAKPANALVTDPDTGQGIETHPMFPSIAVDRNSGNLYAAWQDARFSNFQYNGIAYSMSSDGGLSWSAPVQVNQTPNTVPSLDRQAFNPSVAVAANGTVAVSYYDFRNNTAAPGALTDYWLAYTSAPGSAAWSEVRLTEASFNLEQAPTRFNGGFFLGDYEGLAAAGNDFVAVWGMPDGSATAQESIFFRRTSSSTLERDSIQPVAPAAVLNPPGTEVKPELGITILPDGSTTRSGRVVDHASGVGREFTPRGHPSARNHLVQPTAPEPKIGHRHGQDHEANGLSAEGLLAGTRELTRHNAADALFARIAGE